MVNSCWIGASLEIARDAEAAREGGHLPVARAGAGAGAQSAWAALTRVRRAGTVGDG